MTYNLFISHSWTYHDEYARLIGLLRANPYFHFKDYSVPKNDPILHSDSDAALRLAIREQMRPTSCVLILAGVYSTYSKWINIEINLAKSMGKKIIAIEPYGAERTSSIVKDKADVIVCWNTQSIINAIRD